MAYQDCGTKRFKEYQLHAWVVDGLYTVTCLNKKNRPIGDAAYFSVTEADASGALKVGALKVVALRPGSNSVNPKYKLQGIEAAMRRFAREAFGLPIQPKNAPMPATWAARLKEFGELLK